MKKIIKKLSIILMVVLITVTPSFDFIGNITTISVEAHSGRTDSNGGHRDNKNASGLGSYHYHCDGNPPHLHSNGVCQYKSSSVSNNSSNSSKSISTSNSKEKEVKSETSTSTSVVKKVQTALNKLGYNCGKVDGVLGKKTKAALKEFQKDNNLTVNGKISKQVKKALNIS